MDSSASDPSNPSSNIPIAAPQVPAPVAQSSVDLPVQPQPNPIVYQASAGAIPPVTPQPTPSVPNPVVNQAGLPPLFDDTHPSVTSTTQAASGGHKGIKVLLICSIVLFVGIFGVGSAAAAITYGKLQINNDAITESVSKLVLGLPFTPKTPDYILEKAFLAEKNIKQTSFDISFATNVADLNSLVTGSTGLGKLDMEAKGAIDYSDVNNIALNLNGSITRDFNFDLREKNQMLYFKVNQFPAVLEPYFQTAGDNILDTIKQNWISFDLSSLDTAARRQLDAQTINNASNFDLDALLDKKVVSELQLSDTTSNNLPIYKVSLNADDALVDDVGRDIQKKQGNLELDSSLSNLSNQIKNLKISLWIDKANFYIKEADISFDENYGGSAPGINNLQSRVLGAQAQNIPVSMVIKLSDFNKPVNVDAPASSIPAEQLYTQLINQSLKNVTPPQTIPQSTKLMKTQVKNQSDLLYWTNYLNQFFPLLH